MQCSCSAWLRVGVSPVVPTATSPWLPSATCQFTSPTSAASSTLPSRNGVTRAGIEPLNMDAPPDGACLGRRENRREPYS